MLHFLPHYSYDIDKILLTIYFITQISFTVG